MTTQKLKKTTCCGCLNWLFARWAHRSTPEDLHSIVEDTEIAEAQYTADEQGPGSLSLAPLRNAAQPLTGVEEELPSETLDADGDGNTGDHNSVEVAKMEMAANNKEAEILTITLHMVKRQFKGQETVAEKDWRHKEGDAATGVVAKKDEDSQGRRVETLVIILHLVKREKITEVDEELPSQDLGAVQPHEGLKEELPSQHLGAAQPHEGMKEELPLEQDEGVAATEPPEQMPLKSSLKKKDANQNPVKKTVRFSFQNLNSFVKDRELYSGYAYFKYGFPLSMVRSELQKREKRSVKPQKEPAKEATNSDNKHTEPQRLTGILKKDKAAGTVHKCVRFNLQGMNSFVKDRELYCGYAYFKYGFPLSMVRSELHKREKASVKPQKEAAKEAVTKLPEPRQTVPVKATYSDNKHTEPRLTGILKKGKAAGTVHKCVRFNLQGMNTFVKDHELYCGYAYFRYGVPLSSIRSRPQKLKEETVKQQEGQVQNAVNEATQSPNLTSRHHHQPVGSASNSLRGEPQHLGRPTQRTNDSFHQNSGRNAAHSCTNSRHSQHCHHNLS